MRDKRDIAKAFAEKVKEAGGRAFYVGGCVRDKVLGKEPKDLDIEIHGISTEKALDIIKKFGELHEREVGGKFGVFNVESLDIDFSFPRTEISTGPGHDDFEVVTDPFMGYEKAALRRDFTINAMMEDVLTGEILDFFGGEKDIEAGIIRHVNDRTLKEDPLRIFRAAQFSARLGFDIAPETMELLASIDTSVLSHERIAGETDKALLKSPEPSRFFYALMEIERLSGDGKGPVSTWFPEIVPLESTEQNPVHHPEGSAFVHTMMVLDETAKVKGRTSDAKAFMIAALCHDLGKPATTSFKEGKGIVSYDHDKVGIEPAKELVRRVWNDNSLGRYAVNMTELHMKPRKAMANSSKKKTWMKIWDKSVCPRDLAMLSYCDDKGRDMERPEAEENLETMLASVDEYEKLMEEPHIDGKDLIEAGYKSGPQFSEMLEKAHNMHLAGVDKSTALKQITGMYKSGRQVKTVKSFDELIKAAKESGEHKKTVKKDISHDDMSI